MSEEKTTLYTHEPHPHTPRNPNEVHHAEQSAGGFNTWLAVRLTKATGTMLCAYVFAGIGVGSLMGVLTGNAVLAATFGALSSYFLQLVFLPVLQVGSATLSRHAEIQADETHRNSERILHDLGQLTQHLHAQDAELLTQSSTLQSLQTNQTTEHHVTRGPNGRFVSRKKAASEKTA